MADVLLQNVKKIYDGNVLAVKDANLQIRDEEFIVLVGPSGCGKSTLLRMIAGLEEISEGQISIGGKVVNDVPPKDRDIAMVFQNYALYPHMTVFDNMAFGLKLRKFPKEEIKSRVEDTARLLGIEEYLYRKPKALSGGQRQRVAVGRAIVRKPKVFLFDEPLSNLDAKLRVQMRLEISKLHRRLETTMIYVTHDQVEAMTMGDRIVVMRDGLIQQVDTPLNLYNNPTNMFVAGFIGSPAMNFFKGTLIRNGDMRFRTGTIDIHLTKSLAEKLKNYTKDDIVLGIRPEHIDLETPEGQPTFSSDVEVVEPMGAETYMYMSSGDTDFTVRTSVKQGINVGEKIDLSLHADKIRFFDPETEQNVGDHSAGPVED